LTQYYGKTVKATSNAHVHNEAYCNHQKKIALCKKRLNGMAVNSSLSQLIPCERVRVVRVSVRVRVGAKVRVRIRVRFRLRGKAGQG